MPFLPYISPKLLQDKFGVEQGSNIDPYQTTGQNVVILELKKQPTREEILAKFTQEERDIIEG